MSGWGALRQLKRLKLFIFLCRAGVRCRRPLLALPGLFWPWARPDFRGREPATSPPAGRSPFVR